jgi:hypothetical protein
VTDIARWAGMYADTVTLEAPATLNGAGEVATYGAAVTYKARCVGKIQRVTDTTGQERISSVMTYIFGAPTSLSPRDRITLPARFTPRTPKILAIGQFPDESGLHHVTVIT